MTVTVATFYRFVPVSDTRALAGTVTTLCAAGDIRGTVLIAPEGLNATISGGEAGIAAVLDGLRSDARFASLEAKRSLAAEHPFRRLKVKVKREIVTFGVPEADPASLAGTRVPPGDWNALISDPEVVVVDTRNAYEAAIGSFAGAIDPGLRSFAEFKAYVRTNLDPSRHGKVAMFCTGGIRCEKASAYLRLLGFAAVYQLEGGILKYLETVPQEESLWQGECFVFDDRVSLAHGVRPGQHRLCRTCGHPVAAGDAMCRACGGEAPAEDAAARGPTAGRGSP